MNRKLHIVSIFLEYYNLELYMFCPTISFEVQWFSVLAAHWGHSACFNKNTDMWVPPERI